MYYYVYHFLLTYFPIVLHRPFLFSSIYPIVLSPLFGWLERYDPSYFVDRGGINKPLDKETLYHMFTFVCLFACSLIDPKTMELALQELPSEPPTVLSFAISTTSLIMFYEVALSLLHILFHRVKWLYSNVHYVHHLDTDPYVISTTKLHIVEVMTVFLVMYFIPVRLFDPHPWCLLSSFMVTSVLGILAHSGIRGWHLSEYHRQHHKDPRHNLWNPILSYLMG